MQVFTRMPHGGYQMKKTISQRNYFPYLIAAVEISCVFQLTWFGFKCFSRVDFDGISYIGVSRHLIAGEFHESINAFRSPLLSWMIAALSGFGSDLLATGKILTIASFTCCTVLLYVFTLRLWSSRLAAALAVLWFTLGRGIIPKAVELVTPDFLFAFLVLAYFLSFIHCFQTNKNRDWLLLGVFHALAFLAKAFALPWLALTTLVALAISTKAMAPKHSLVWD